MWAAGSVVHLEHRQGFGKLVIFYSRARPEFSLSLAVHVPPRTRGGGGGAGAWPAGGATGTSQPAPGGPRLPGTLREAIPPKILLIFGLCPKRGGVLVLTAIQTLLMHFSV